MFKRQGFIKKNIMNKSLVAAIVLNFSIPIFAADEPSTDHTNSVTINWGVGVLNSNINDQDPIDAAFRASYEYKLTPVWSFEAGYLTGDSDRANLILDILFDSKTKFNAFQAGVKGSKKLGKSNRVFVRADINYYDVEVDSGSQQIFGDTGTGYDLAIGWQYDFSENVGVILEYAYDDFGDITRSSTNLGLSISF